MVTIAGYEGCELLQESRTSRVYRGYRCANRLPGILKLLLKPDPTRLAWFQREFTLLQRLQLPGIIRTEALEHADDRWVLVLEDFGSESLVRLRLVGRCPIGQALPILHHVAETLGQIHQHQVIHKDLSPANILYNPQTGEVKLADFSIAAEISRETPAFANPTVIEGTLVYISPEQTGRMNRAVDYRTDFYGLGAVGYELLVLKLLVIGAYPNTDVDETHPVLRLATEVAAAGTAVHRIALTPLGTVAITTLLAETLHSSTVEVGPLAKLLGTKTGGNPFFTRSVS